MGDVVPRSFVDVLTVALLAVEELDRQARLAGDGTALRHLEAARQALHGLHAARTVTT